MTRRFTPEINPEEMFRRYQEKTWELGAVMAGYENAPMPPEVEAKLARLLQPIDALVREALNLPDAAAPATSSPPPATARSQAAGRGSSRRSAAARSRSGSREA